MKRYSLSLLGLLFVSLLVVTGCSSSEETVAEDEMSAGEFQRVDPDDEVTPIADPVEEDVPSTERNLPAPREAAPVPAPPPPGSGAPTSTDPAAGTQTRTGLMMWSVQIGAFKLESGAIALINEARARLNQPLYKDYDPVTGFYKVTVGSFQTREQASQFKTDVQSRGYPDAFTVEVRR